MARRGKTNLFIITVKFWHFDTARVRPKQIKKVTGSDKLSIKY